MPNESLTVRAGWDVVREPLLERDEVHDAALESFPASDAPSWSALRIGPPAPHAAHAHGYAPG